LIFTEPHQPAEATNLAIASVAANQVLYGLASHD
jgi:hypothetical protein